MKYIGYFAEDKAANRVEGFNVDTCKENNGQDRQLNRFHLSLWVSEDILDMLWRCLREIQPKVQSNVLPTSLCYRPQTKFGQGNNFRCVRLSRGGGEVESP